MAQVLRDLAVGQHGRVVGFQATAQAYKRKLLALGLTPGTEFTVVRCAPLGDPIEILVRGFHLSLRQDEAAVLQIEEIEHA
jgi:ferrous iron transport protein A